MIVLWKQLHEKWKLQICSQCLSKGVKYRKKLLQVTIPLIKWIRLRAYSHSVKNLWISSLTLTLTFRWIEPVILRSHRKIHQNLSLILEIFGKENLYCTWPETLSSTLENLFHPEYWYGRDFIMWWILCYASLTFAW